MPHRELLVFSTPDRIRRQHRCSIVRSFLCVNAARIDRPLAAHPCGVQISGSRDGFKAERRIEKDELYKEGEQPPRRPICMRRGDSQRVQIARQHRICYRHHAVLPPYHPRRAGRLKFPIMCRPKKMWLVATFWYCLVFLSVLNDFLTKRLRFGDISMRIGTVDQTRSMSDDNKKKGVDQRHIPKMLHQVCTICGLVYIPIYLLFKTKRATTPYPNGNQSSMRKIYF